VVGLQAPGSWHAPAAVHTTGFLPTHAPATQTSVKVQAFWSLQAVRSGAVDSGQLAVTAGHRYAGWQASSAPQTRPPWVLVQLTRGSQPPFWLLHSSRSSQTYVPGPVVLHTWPIWQGPAAQALIGEQMPARHSKPKEQAALHVMLVAGLGAAQKESATTVTVPDSTQLTDRDAVPVPHSTVQAPNAPVSHS